MVWWAPSSLRRQSLRQDLPALHAREGVLDAGSDLLVRPVVFLLPVRESLALATACGMTSPVPW